MILLLHGCEPEPADSGAAAEPAEAPEPGLSGAEREALAKLWPLPAVPEDPTNAFADDPRAAQLGQYLYFDERLSEGNAVSCATCHDPTLGWGDGRRLSEGVGTTGRHAPVVANAAFNRWMFWDGRCDTLWCQAVGPIEAGAEMGGSRLAVAHLLAADRDLGTAYEGIFGDLPPLDDAERFPARGRPSSGEADALSDAWEGMTARDQAAIDAVFANVGKSLAAFERRVVTRNAPFDAWAEAVLTADPADTTLAPAAIAGYQLFVGRGNCHFCHSGPTFTNGEFVNVGLGARDWLDPADRGRIDGIAELLTNPFNGAGAYSDDPSTAAQQLSWLTVSTEQEGAFKVPTLRNVAESAPYMHGGHFDTLTAVLAFYGQSAPEAPVYAHRETLLLDLELTAEEQASLVAFLESLTGEVDPALTIPPASPIWDGP